MRAHLIVNPSSGTDRAVEMLPLMRSRLGALFEDLIVTVTAGADDLKKAAARTVAENCAALYVAGGDGTVNGALRGVLESSFGPGYGLAIESAEGEGTEVRLTVPKSHPGVRAA